MAGIWETLMQAVSPQEAQAAPVAQDAPAQRLMDALQSGETIQQRDLPRAPTDDEIKQRVLERWGFAQDTSGQLRFSADYAPTFADGTPIKTYAAGSPVPPEMTIAFARSLADEHRMQRMFDPYDTLFQGKLKGFEPGAYIQPGDPRADMLQQIWKQANARQEPLAVSTTAPTQSLTYKDPLTLGAYNPDQQTLWMNTSSIMDYPDIQQGAPEVAQGYVRTLGHELLHYLMNVTTPERRRLGLMLAEPSRSADVGQYDLQEHEMIARMLGEQKKGMRQGTLAEQAHQQAVADYLLSRSPGHAFPPPQGEDEYTYLDQTMAKPPAPSAWQRLLQFLGTTPGPVPAQGMR